jgi:AmmeMemoRadiSam system protein B
MSDSPLPAVRPLDVLPIVDDDGVPRILVQDNSRIATAPLAVSQAGYFVMAHLDGQRSADEIIELFAEQYNAQLDPAQIMDLIKVLDESLMLVNDRSEAAYQKQVNAYLDSEVRDNRESWPSADALREEVDKLLDSALVVVSDHADDLRGVVAPHLDYERGQQCYRAAYGALRAAGPADRYVILGTNHYGRSTGVVATGKDFLTPFGRVETDRRYLSALNDRLPFDLFEYEYDHLREHSVELQVHLLQAMFPDHPFSIVPILCTDPMCRDEEAEPCTHLDQLAGALRETLANDEQRTIVIAGADLSHVGQRFGTPQPSCPELLEAVRVSDEQYLDRLTQRDELVVTDEIRANGNPTQICSTACIYVLAQSLPDLACELLSYDQAVDYENETHVTCAALTYRES